MEIREIAFVYELKDHEVSRKLLEAVLIGISSEHALF
jgi:hypothetical protein